MARKISLTEQPVEIDPDRYQGQDSDLPEIFWKTQAEIDEEIWEALWERKVQ